MLTNMFGEPRPATLDEIVVALDMVDLLPMDAQAIIYDNREDRPPYNGFTATISHSDTGEQSFETCGFEDKEALIEGLEGLGIALIIDEADAC